MTEKTDRDLRIFNTMLARRTFLAGAAGVALFGPAFAQGSPKTGGVLKISAPTNPSSLDPTTGGSGRDHVFLWTMFDTLVEWDYATLKTKPGLAKWTFPDPLTMVLDIHPGILFHDGTALNAEAVKYNFERNRTDARSNLKADLSNVKSVEVTGPLQVTLKLAGPDASLPAILSDRAGMMVSPTALQAAGTALDRKPVGTGPWTFVSWSDNQSVVVKRNEKYWRNGRPYLDGIEFSIIPEVSTGLRSVVAGQNDMAYEIPARQKPVIDRAKNLSAASHPTLFCMLMFLNYGRPPLDNIKVRQALNFAVDRDAFMKAAYGTLGERATMLVPSSHWAFDPETAKLYPHDPDKAKQLLAEAGYKDGLELVIGTYSDQDSTRRGEVIFDQLGKAGIRVKYITGTTADISGQFFGTEKKFAAQLSPWTGRPDPSMTYNLMFSKGSYFNAGRTEATPELTTLLQQSQSVEDITERAKIFAKLQRVVMEQALVVPLAFQFELVALSQRVKGYSSNLLGKPKFEDVWIEG